MDKLSIRRLQRDRGVEPPAARCAAVTTRAASASWTGATSQIWVSKIDGSDAHPITFGPGDFQVETVLKNGMILATARSPLLPSNGLPADRELYTLRPDGTGSGNAALRSSAPRDSQPSARTRRRRGGLREGFAHQPEPGRRSRLDSPRRIAQCPAHGPAHSCFVAAAPRRR